jgi:HD-like signal output (HDOD) protein
VCQPTSPPGVAVRVIELARDPEVDLGKLASVVVADPALVAKILRTANSSLYANHRKSENLRQALGVAGAKRNDIHCAQLFPG